MRITAEITINCPSGFYCKNCDRCNYKMYNEPYCELFYPFLEIDTKGNVLKCEQCLLAERAERLKR